MIREILGPAMAFIRRDFHVETSYKFQFVFQLTAGFFIVIFFYYISQMIDSGSSASLTHRYNSDYFSFVIVGVAAAGFLLTGLSGFAERLRMGMTEGSLEMTFSCPVHPILILVLPCVWAFFFEAVKAVVVIAFAVIVFGADFSRANILACLPVLFLTITSYSVFGILSASVILVIKRGDPINFVFSAAASLLAGAYFPTDLLPSWLAPVINILPMTYAYEGLRATLLGGAGLSQVSTEIMFLGGFSIVGLPLAFWFANRAITKAKQIGSLGTF